MYEGGNLLWSQYTFLPESREIPLTIEYSGRLSIPFDDQSVKFPCAQAGREDIWMMNPQPTLRILRPGKLKKLHISLGHGAMASLSKILTLAGYHVGRQRISALISTCGCDQSRAIIGRQKSQRHVPICPGHTAFFDITYLKENDAHRSPFGLTVDASSRFVICKPLSNIRAMTVISSFGKSWSFFFGRPKFLIRDGGPGLVGLEWEQYGAARDISFISNPKDTQGKWVSRNVHAGYLSMAFRES